MFSPDPFCWIRKLLCAHQRLQRIPNQLRYYSLRVESLEDRVVPNAAPVAVADGYNFHQGQTLNVVASGVLTNDTDADNDTLHAVLDTDVSHGYLTLNSDGSFSYFPGTDVSAGTDSFTYYANDGTVNSDDPVTVTLTLVNDAPVAIDQTYTIHQGRALTIPASFGLLYGATDTDDDSLEVVVDDEPTYGSLEASSDGSFIYYAGTAQTESDSFTFHVRDGAANSDTMTVTLTFVNSAPVLQSNLTYTVLPTGSLALYSDLIANATDDDGDGNALSITIDSQPTHGSVDAGVYTPDSSTWTGSDSFTYHVSDGVADSNTVTVNITIADEAIIANPVLAQTHMEEEVVIPQSVVLANCMSQTATPWIVSYNDYTAAAHGTVTQDGSGNFHYMPDEGFTGADSFSYTVYDGVNSATALVAITVQVTNSVVLEFSNFNVPNGAAGWVTIIINDSGNGAASRLRVVFPAGANTAANVVTVFSEGFAGDGWTARANGTSLFISFRTVNGMRRQLTRLQINEANVDEARRPLITVGGDVSVVHNTTAPQ